MPDISSGVIVLIVLGLLIPILPNLWAIWHIFHSDFATSAHKLGWLLAAMFLPVLGGLAYCCIGRKQATRVL